MRVFLVTECFSHYETSVFCNLFFFFFFLSLGFEGVSLQLLWMKLQPQWRCLNLWHGQPRARAEWGAQLHSARGICVKGLESCLFTSAGMMRLFGECLPFLRHKYIYFVYRGKPLPLPQLGQLSFTWVKANSTRSCPQLSRLLQSRAWKPHFGCPSPGVVLALAPGHAPPPTAGSTFTAALPGGGFLGYFSLRADTSPQWQDEWCCSLGTCCWEQSPAPLPLPRH